MKSVMQQIQSNAQELLTATAGSSFTIGWLAVANQYLQAIAFLVAITAGSIVIYKHFRGGSNGNRKAE